MPSSGFYIGLYWTKCSTVRVQRASLTLLFNSLSRPQFSLYIHNVWSKRNKISSNTFGTVSLRVKENPSNNAVNLSVN